MTHSPAEQIIPFAFHLPGMIANLASWQGGNTVRLRFLESQSPVAALHATPLQANYRAYPNDIGKMGRLKSESYVRMFDNETPAAVVLRNLTSVCSYSALSES